MDGATNGEGIPHRIEGVGTSSQADEAPPSSPNQFGSVMAVYKSAVPLRKNDKFKVLDFLRRHLVASSADMDGKSRGTIAILERREAATQNLGKKNM